MRVCNFGINEVKKRFEIQRSRDKCIDLGKIKVKLGS